ncbi:MAG: ABC transporter permease [Ruminococcaceae bacterium]|nr:ABC transporter permease [Oscillospiraceae bacterium]
MKYFFQDLWQSIKNKPLFSLLLFIQLTVTGLVLYMSLTDMLIISEKANTAKINWGDKDYAYILPDSDNISSIESMTLTSPFGPGVFFKEEEAYNNQIELYKKLEQFYNEIRQIEGLNVIVREPTSHTLLTDPKDIEGKEIGDPIDISQANVEYTEGNTVAQFNSYYVGKDHLEFFDIKLSEGEYFSEESYTNYENGTQILLGNNFRDQYKIGDVLYFAHYGNQNITNLTKATVCGFIEKDQYYTTVGSASNILRYDDAALIPYLELSLDEYLEKYDNLLGIYSLRIYGANLIFDGGTYDTIMPMIKEVVEKYELTDYIQITKSRVERVLSSNYQDRYKISLSFIIISIMLAIVSVVFIMLYRAESEMKKNAICMLVGQTQIGMIGQSISIMAAYFTVAMVLSSNLFTIYNVIKGMTTANDRYVTVPAYWLTCAIMVVMFILSAIAVVISMKIKFSTVSIATLIRGNDIKRGNKITVYKTLLAMTFVFHSIFMMFISGFAFSLEKIDMYYMGFNTEIAKTASVSVEEYTENMNEKIDFEALGKDIVVNKYVSMEYVGENRIVVRGIYLNGDVPMLDIQKGRFFTDNEYLNNNPLAVVGPEIYNNYVYTGEDGKEYYKNEHLNTEFEVIGVFGKEGSVSNMDFTVFVPMGYAMNASNTTGSYTLDAKDKDSLAILEANFTAQLAGKLNVLTYENPPIVNVSTSLMTMGLMFVLTMINSIVFSSYYVLKQKHILSVKKFIGYSPKLILLDTFLSFMALVGVSFIIGNLIMSVLTETILSQIELFDLYTLDLRTLVVSFVGTAILALIFSAIAIHNTFTKGTSETLRG